MKKLLLLITLFVLSDAYQSFCFDFKDLIGIVKTKRFIKVILINDKDFIADYYGEKNLVIGILPS